MRQTTRGVAGGLMVAAMLLGYAPYTSATMITGVVEELTPGDSSDFVTLDRLLTGGDIAGLQVGDKVFDEFFYSTLPGDDMPAPEDINVFGFTDLDGNFGLSFHGAFIDLPGGGPSDALVRFTVQVTEEAFAQGYRISDAHLFIGGTGVGENSVLTVDETFQGQNAALNAFVTSINTPDPVSQLSDGVVFDEPLTELRVEKDIFAFASNDAILPVRTTVIDQSFSQVRVVIPEPTTVSFAVFGVAVATSLRRRREG